MTLPAVAPEAVVVKLEPGRRYILRPPAGVELSLDDAKSVLRILKESAENGDHLLLFTGWTIFDATGAEVGMEETQG